MPVVLENTTPCWGIWKIEETAEELLGLLNNKSAYLPELEKITNELRRREWLAVRVLLKEILGEEKQICYFDSGKPYLQDTSYFLSITHTKNYVAVMLDKKAKPGIDIELISPRIRKVRDRFMSEAETANLSRQYEDIHLLLHWSAKESMFKALGEQDVEFRECLHIEAFKPVINELSSFCAYETKTECRYRFVINYMVNPEYLLTFTLL